MAKLWGIKGLTEGLSDFLSTRKKESVETIEEELMETKKYQVFFVVFLLISLPFMTFTSVTLSDHYMRKSTVYVSTWEGQYVVTKDLVKRSIEGKYDSQKVIDKMKEKPDIWHTEDILEELDLEDLNKIPGRLSVYRMGMGNYGRDDIVITYTYLSPLPITRTFGFKISPTGEAYLVEENTMIYPMNPGNPDPFSL